MHALQIPFGMLPTLHALPHEVTLKEGLYAQVSCGFALVRSVCLLMCPGRIVDSWPDMHSSWQRASQDATRIIRLE